MLLTKRYASYILESAFDLDSSLLQYLTSIFDSPPKERTDPGLGGRTSISLTSIEGIGPVVVKQYARGGLIRHVMKSHYLRIGKCRSQKEYEYLEKMLCIGLNVPEPVLFAHKGTLLYKAWLVTKRISHTQTLADLSLKDESRALSLMPRVVSQLSVLVENKVLHVDFHPGNVLVDNNDRVFIVDFDRASLFGGSRNRLKNRYLVRWRRSIVKHRMPKMLYETMNI